MIEIDTGDVVFHRRSRETWLVACVIGDRLSWCGWPEGRAWLSDCLLVEKATPSERRQLLLELARPRPAGDHRRDYAAARMVAEWEAITDEPWIPGVEMGVCIGCGCDDLHACRGGCSWLELEGRFGVCSNCDDMLERWAAGERGIVGHLLGRHGVG